MKKYYVYIVLCNDNSYYTGLTNNLERRIIEHNDGVDSTSYTYSRRPVTLVYYDYFHDVRNAISYEKQIKRWSRKKKEALIKSDWDNLKKHSRNYTQFGKPE